MAISYNKLWKLLIDRKMSKAEHKQQLDTFNSIGSLNLNQSQIMMLKRYAPWFFSTKNEKRVHQAATIFECIAFAILFVGLTVPIPILYNEKISDIATVLSFGFLFLSMWQVEKNAERKAQWEDIQLMAIRPHDLLRGKGCPQCRKRKAKTQ